MSRLFRVLCVFLCAFGPLRAQLVISEFLASNVSGLRDELGKPEDWIEIHNYGTSAVSLSGYFLTDSATDVRKWAFPAWTLNAGNRLVVFASSRDQRPTQTTAGSDNAGTLVSPRLATNFKLGTGSGGFLGLTKDAGGGITNLISSFASYPKQYADFSYGRGSGSAITIFSPDQPGVLKYLVPTASTPADWNTLAYDASAWTAASGTAIGFDSDLTGPTSFVPHFTVNLGIPASGVPHVMWNVNASLYTRYTFNVPDKAAVSGLLLKIKYEDGFVAWLNGVEVARGNFAGTPLYNSGTGTNRASETLSLSYDTFDLGPAAVAALQNGNNVLAIQGINFASNSSDFLLAPYLQGISVLSSDMLMMPTPGAENSGAATPATLAFSVPSGLFTGTLSVSITGQQPGQVVRYTTDGTEPTLAVGTTYAGPLAITTSTSLKARIFFANTAGPMADAHYILRGTAPQYGITPATFASSLPILVIDGTSATALTDTVPSAARFSLIDRSAVDQKARLTDAPAFTTRGTINVRGQTSAGLAKKGYGIEFRNAAELDKNLPVLGMPADSDWVLYASYQYDTDFMRNVLMYEFYRRTGRWAPQTRYVDVFLNPAGPSVDGADYLGVYVLMEKIKLDSNRINLKGVTPLDNTGDALTGAYMFAHDKQEAGNPANELLQNGNLANWNTGNSFIIKEPNYLDLTTQQRAYLIDLILKVDNALGASNFINPTTGLHYRDYIARDSFIDHHMFNAFAKNIDGLRISTYFQKDRLGKINMSSIWDFDRSMDSDTESRDDNPAYWNSDPVGPYLDSTDYFTGFGNYKAEGWFHRLQQDPDYIQEWVDRFDRWRSSGVIDATVMNAFLDQKAAELLVPDNGGADTPIARNYYRWPRAVRGTTTNQTNAASLILGSGTSELTRQKTWIQQRIAFMDTFVLAKPAASVASGIVTPTTDILLASADSSGGAFYYTKDGSDPRATGGGIAAGASAYSSSIRMATSGFVTARLFKTGLSPLTKHTDWSAPVKVYYTVGATPASSADLRVSELMYHPADPSAAEIAAGFTDSDQFEYIELLNAGTGPINLYGAKFTTGVDFSFSDALKPALLQMAPGDRILVVKNLAAFTYRFGATAAARVIGEFAGNDNLNNAGETITITASDLSTILLFAYSDTAPWPTEADGLGSSLVFTSGNPSDSLSWRLGGGPGVADATTLASWKIQKSIVSDNGDNDGDGLSNLLEYVTGSDPAVASLTTLPVITGNPDGTTTVTVSKRLDADGVTFVFETADALGTWTPITGVLQTRTFVNGREIRTYTLPAEAATGSRFHRVRYLIP